MRTVQLQYLGTGTVRIEGAGEVTSGGGIELPEEVAVSLVEQQPGQWKLISAGPADTQVFEGAASPPDGRPTPAGGA